MKLLPKLKCGNYQGFSCKLTIISFSVLALNNAGDQFLLKTLALDRPNCNVNKPPGPFKINRLIYFCRNISFKSSMN